MSLRVQAQCFGVWIDQRRSMFDSVVSNILDVINHIEESSLIRDLFSPIMEKYPDILQKLTDILVQRETENIRKHKNIDLDEDDVSIAEIFREKLNIYLKIDD